MYSGWATHSARREAWVISQLQRLAERRVSLPEFTEVRVCTGIDVVATIAREAERFDIVILHSQRQPVAAEGFGLSIMTNALIRRLAGSAIVIGEVQAS